MILMKKRTINVEALIVATVFAIFTAIIFIWVFLGLNLNNNLLLGCLTFIAMLIIDTGETISIYYLHKNYVDRKQELIKAKQTEVTLEVNKKTNN